MSKLGRPKQDRQPQTTTGLRLQLDHHGAYLTDERDQPGRVVFLPASLLRDLLAVSVEARQQAFSAVTLARWHQGRRASARPRRGSGGLEDAEEGA